MFQADAAQYGLFQRRGPRNADGVTPAAAPFAPPRPHELRLEGTLAEGVTYSPTYRRRAGQDRLYVRWSASAAVTVTLEHRPCGLFVPWQKADGEGGSFLVDAGQTPLLAHDCRLAVACPAGGAAVTADLAEGG